MKNIKSWEEVYVKESGIRQHLGSLYTHSLLFDHILNAKPRTILEVGTGSGIMGIFLSLLGYEVWAIDNNQAVLERAQGLGLSFGSRVKYSLVDAFSLKQAFQEKSFDLVFSQGFFEHFNDEQIKLLLKQQLSISSKVFFSVPSMYYPLRDIGNERLLSIARWKRMLLNFNIDYIQYYGYYLPNKKELYGSLFNPSFYWRVLFSLLIRGSSHILIEVCG
jgi:2-polyprenyl-3-methyl-5-hydroxy-6-metoxy-1,4-benzoquinol methylase